MLSPVWAELKKCSSSYTTIILSFICSFICLLKKLSLTPALCPFPHWWPWWRQRQRSQAIRSKNGAARLVTRRRIKSCNTNIDWQSCGSPQERQFPAGQQGSLNPLHSAIAIKHLSCLGPFQTGKLSQRGEWDAQVHKAGKRPSQDLILG